MDVQVDLQIVDLRLLPLCIPEIAAWHHAEWMKGLPEKVHREQQRQGVVSKDIYEREHSLRAHLESKAVPSTFIAHRNSVPVGSVSIVNYQFSRDQKPSQWLTNLFVIESCRRRGLALRLIDHALNFCAENNISLLYLYARDLDDYYQKRGWQFSHEGIVQGQKVSVFKYLIGA